MKINSVLRASLLGVAIVCSAAASAATTELKTAAVPTFTATYKSGTANTLTIRAKNFSLYSLMDLSPADSAKFSVAGSAPISVFTSNANTPVFLLTSVLSSNANFFYTVAVSKKGIARAVCKSFATNNVFFSFTATNDSPPSKGTFTLVFVVENVGALPVTGTKSPAPTLEGLPNITLQIGSAYFTTTKIKKNKATYP
jgi:hypothetical protein